MHTMTPSAASPPGGKPADRGQAEPGSAVDEHLRRRRNGGPPGRGSPGRAPSGGRPPRGKPPRVGGGQLQWNTWGWFGGQIGSTVWLVVLGVVAIAQGDALGTVPVALCALANLVGALLWRARDRLAPLTAVELLLGTIAVLSAAAVATILEGGLLGSGPGLPPGRWVYLYLLIFPALMVQLWVVDRANGGRPTGPGDKDADGRN